MLTIAITFQTGPQKGITQEVNIGTLVVGREPVAEGDQQALVLPGAGASVSRTHFEISYALGEVKLRGISANGTKAKDKSIAEECVLSPGAIVSPSDEVSLKLDWTPVVARATEQQKKKEPTNLAKSGPLASPVIRAVIGVYLLGIVGVAVWLGGSSGSTGFDSGASKRLLDSYRRWGTEIYSPATLEANLESVEYEMDRLRVALATGNRKAAKQICLSLRALDEDRTSPVYAYAAKCIARY